AAQEEICSHDLRKCLPHEPRHRCAHVVLIEPTPPARYPTAPCQLLHRSLSSQSPPCSSSCCPCVPPTTRSPSPSGPAKPPVRKATSGQSTTRPSLARGSSPAS